MAYTYDNFTTAATKAGLLNSFSDDDLTIAKSNPEYGLSLLQLRQEYNNASTAEQKLLAQEAENQLRTTYGGLNTGKTTEGSFSYANQNAYQKLLNEVSNPGSFSYDPDSDESYGAYKKAYLREADRATKDTMAEASAMSGGRPSTYAISAAQQAGNYYRGQLNDALPTLEQNAYQRYLSDYETKLSGLDALTADRNFDYNAYLQEYEQKQQEWNNALTLYQMGIQTDAVLKTLGIPSTGSSGGSSGGGSSSGGRAQETASDEEQGAIDFVNNMLGNITNSASDPSRIISGTSALTPTQKEYAQSYLTALLNSGAMK